MKKAPVQDIESSTIFRTPTVFLDKRGQPYTWDNLFSIRADELRQMFPALAHWLTHDSYMTVHAYHRSAPYTNK